jgi:dTDP-4-dehydrorhamnose 3,5-epimerase
MDFQPLGIAGAFLVRLSRHEDARGFFARTFCVDEFAEHGLPTQFPQQSLARSERRGTLRGMHMQLEPHAEDKYIRCVRGRIFDAIVDLRPASPTYLRQAHVELGAEDGDAIFVPRGLAHGYQTLAERTDVIYAMSERYSQPASRAFRWNDPAFAIPWPLANPILSPADASSGTAAALIEEVVTRSRSVATG